MVGQYWRLDEAREGDADGLYVAAISQRLRDDTAIHHAPQNNAIRSARLGECLLTLRTP